MMAIVILLALQETERTYFDEASGEVTLAANNAKLVEHSKPAKWHVITDMVVFRGRLIASAAHDFDTEWFLKPWSYSNGAQILEYSVDKDAWSVIHDTDESMVMNVRVVGDLLMVPEFFPLNEKSRLVHTFDGEKWDHLGLLPVQNWHVMDVIKIGETLYVSGSWRDAGEKDQFDDPNWWPGYGRVFDSKDGGKTWREIRRTKENGRVLDMVEFQGKLYANERGMQLIAWDGKKWEEVPVKLGTADAKLGSAHLMVFADKIVAINASLVYTFDGKKWASQQPGYIDLWRDGKKLYGLRDDGHVSVTEDAVKWTRVTTEGVPAKEFDRQAARGRPLHRGSVALHRGRLFVGTGAEGRIYAASYYEKGRFTSKPLEVAGTTATWEAASPKGTSSHLKVRTAESSEKLEKAAWRDVADFTSKLSGKWMQYRVELESDGRHTPVIKPPRYSKE